MAVGLTSCKLYSKPDDNHLVGVVCEGILPMIELRKNMSLTCKLFKLYSLDRPMS
jgi:hypothetical protein